MRIEKVKTITIAPNPYINALRAHKRLPVMVQARLENDLVRRRFFTTRDKANAWINELFETGRVVN